jgi:hypothetical protein
LSPKSKFRAIKSFAQISLTVRLACAVHSLKQIPHHGNFHHHRVIAASERLRLPDPWNLGGTSFHKSLPVHGDRCVFPQTPDSRFRDLRRSRNNDDDTTDRPLSLLVRWGPPQGMRTLRIDRTDGRNVVEDTAARGATATTQGGAGRTRKHTTINRRARVNTHNNNGVEHKEPTGRRTEEDGFERAYAVAAAVAIFAVDFAFVGEESRTVFEFASPPSSSANCSKHVHKQKTEGAGARRSVPGGGKRALPAEDGGG